MKKPELDQIRDIQQHVLYIYMYQLLPATKKTFYQTITKTYVQELLLDLKIKKGFIIKKINQFLYLLIL